VGAELRQRAGVGDERASVATQGKERGAQRVMRLPQRRLQTRGEQKCALSLFAFALLQQSTAVRARLCCQRPVCIVEARRSGQQ